MSESTPYIKRVPQPPLGSILRPFTDTNQIPGTPTGNYYFDCTPSGGGVWQISVNGDHGGGWIVAYNMLRPIGNNTVPVVTGPNPLPIVDWNKNLGDDGTVGNEWGACTGATLECFTMQGGLSECRHWGITTNHSRVVDFSTTHPLIVPVITTTGGELSGAWLNLTTPAGVPGVLSPFTTLFPPHTANVPIVADNSVAVNGTPIAGYYGSQAAYFQGGGFGNNNYRGGTRWEIDDIPSVLFSAASTWWQVMFRA